MSQQHPPYQPYQPYQQPPVKKSHTTRNVIVGVVVGFFVMIGGCTAIVAAGADQASKNVSDTSATSAPAVTGQPKVAKSPAPAAARSSQAAPKATTSKPVAPPKPTATAPAMTIAQENALKSAQNYLEYQAFSKRGLIQQLSSKYGEGYAKADAIWAVDHLTVNWNEQAYKSGKNYLEFQPFSRSGLIQQLSSDAGEKFTKAQAVYAVNKLGL